MGLNVKNLKIFLDAWVEIEGIASLATRWPPQYYTRGPAQACRRVRPSARECVNTGRVCGCHEATELKSRTTGCQATRVHYKYMSIQFSTVRK
jgi:hypothetical protein